MSPRARWTVRRELAAFFALLVLVRGPFYVVSVVGGWGNNARNVPPAVVLWAMLSAPPLFAAAVLLASRGTLRGPGWKPGRPVYLVPGWLAPVIVALATYGVAWALGLIAPRPDRPLDAGAMARNAVIFTLALVVPTFGPAACGPPYSSTRPTTRSSPRP
ncbi:MAG TPA: hypothetical protein VE913_06095 [Longimicrobium sp.]|nr:hypothetical protein [Longimicrobium sp.]